MEPATMVAAAAAALEFAGGVITNKSSSKEAAKNRAFQEYMSSTAHQREVKDLLQAGLNPVLSTKYSGASSPTGAMPNLQNPFEGATNSAKEISLQAAQKKLLEEQRSTTELQGNQAGSQAGVNATQMGINQELIHKAKEDIKTSRATAQSIALDNDVKKIEVDFLNKYPEVVKTRLLGEAGSAITDVLPSIKIPQKHTYPKPTGQTRR